MEKRVFDVCLKQVPFIRSQKVVPVKYCNLPGLLWKVGFRPLSVRGTSKSSHGNHALGITRLCIFSTTMSSFSIFACCFSLRVLYSFGIIAKADKTSQTILVWGHLSTKPSNTLGRQTCVLTRTMDEHGESTPTANLHASGSTKANSTGVASVLSALVARDSYPTRSPRIVPF